MNWPDLARIGSSLSPIGASRETKKKKLDATPTRRQQCCSQVAESGRIGHECGGHLCISSLLLLFNQQFSVFKQHYMNFHIFFNAHVFLKDTNNVTKIILAELSNCHILYFFFGLGSGAIHPIPSQFFF